METSILDKPIFKEELTNKVLNAFFEKSSNIDLNNETLTPKELFEKAKTGDYFAMYGLSITIANFGMDINDDFEMADRCSDIAVLLGEEVYKIKKEYGLDALGNAYRSYGANYIYNEKTKEWDENHPLEQEREIKSFNCYKELYHLTNTYEALIDWMKISSIVFYIGTDIWKEPANETKEAVEEEKCPAELICIYGEELIIGRLYAQNVNLGVKYLDKAIAMGSERASRAKTRLLNKYGNGKSDSITSMYRNLHNSNGESSSTKTQGCYIATCAYGSYNCPQVWVLRRYRDYYLDNHWWGRLFIKFYYKFSPKFVLKHGNNVKLQNKIRLILDKKVKVLMKNGYSDKPYYDKY